MSRRSPRMSWLLGALALLGSFATVAAAGDPEAARKAIEEVNAAIGRAFENRDPAAFARLYTEDAAIMPPEAPIVRGRKQIETFWKDAMAGGVTGASLQTLEVENLGDTAWEVGVVTLTIEAEGKEPATQKGKYFVLWKRQADGAWRLHRDIWNPMPAESAQ